MEANNNVKKASRLGVICYGLGDLASQFVWTFVGSYLTIFYTDIVGFAPIVVSVIMLIARVWDAVNDPMMGAIAENTRSKFGRFRPYIAFGCPFLASRNPDPIRIELKRLLSAGTALKLFPLASGLSVFALRQAKIKQKHRRR